MIAEGPTLILDTTLIGGEALGRTRSTGLEPSIDQTTANFRIALPTSGVASRLLNVETDSVPELNDVDANGERRILSDAERNAAEQEARAAVRRYCG